MIFMSKIKVLKFIEVITISSIFVGIAILGCGSENVDEGDEQDEIQPLDCGFENSSGTFFPFNAGNRWGYQAENDPTSETNYTSFGGPTEDGNLVVSFPDGVQRSSMTEYTKIGNRIGVLSFIEENQGAYETHYTYEPPKLVLSEDTQHLVKGATWTETTVRSSLSGGGASGGMIEVLEEVDVTLKFTVIDIDTPCTVPAGTSDECLTLRIEETLDSETRIREIVYAKNVGPVRRISNPDRENSVVSVLADCSVAE